jgi:LSD1 subclass zinc finger protein
MIPLNYRRGSTKEHCSNCGAFHENLEQSFREYVGYCDMYSMLVKSSQTCDKWYDRQTVQKDSENSENSPSK